MTFPTILPPSTLPLDYGIQGAWDFDLNAPICTFKPHMFKVLDETDPASGALFPFYTNIDFDREIFEPNSLNQHAFRNVLELQGNFGIRSIMRQHEYYLRFYQDQAPIPTDVLHSCLREQYFHLMEQPKIQERGRIGSFYWREKIFLTYATGPILDTLMCILLPPTINPNLNIPQISNPNSDHQITQGCNYQTVNFHHQEATINMIRISRLDYASFESPMIAILLTIPQVIIFKLFDSQQQLTWPMEAILNPSFSNKTDFEFLMIEKLQFQVHILDLSWHESNSNHGRNELAILMEDGSIHLWQESSRKIRQLRTKMKLQHSPYGGVHGTDLRFFQRQKEISSSQKYGTKEDGIRQKTEREIHLENAIPYSQAVPWATLIFGTTPSTLMVISPDRIEKLDYSGEKTKRIVLVVFVGQQIPDQEIGDKAKKGPRNPNIRTVEPLKWKTYHLPTIGSLSSNSSPIIEDIDENIPEWLKTEDFNSQFETKQAKMEQFQKGIQEEGPNLLDEQDVSNCSPPSNIPQILLLSTEQVRCASIHPTIPFRFLVATTKRVFLLDERFPGMPLLDFRHHLTNYPILGKVSSLLTWPHCIQSIKVLDASRMMKKEDQSITKDRSWIVVSSRQGAQIFTLQESEQPQRVQLFQDLRDQIKTKIQSLTQDLSKDHSQPISRRRRLNGKKMAKIEENYQDFGENCDNFKNINSSLMTPFISNPPIPRIIGMSTAILRNIKAPEYEHNTQHQQNLFGTTILPRSWTLRSVNYNIDKMNNPSFNNVAIMNDHHLDDKGIKDIEEEGEENEGKMKKKCILAFRLTERGHIQGQFIPINTEDTSNIKQLDHAQTINKHNEERSTIISTDQVQGMTINHESNLGLNIHFSPPYPTPSPQYSPINLINHPYPPINRYEEDKIDLDIENESSIDWMEEREIEHDSQSWSDQDTFPLNPLNNNPLKPFPINTDNLVSDPMQPMTQNLLLYNQWISWNPVSHQVIDDELKDNRQMLKEYFVFDVECLYKYLFSINRPSFIKKRKRRMAHIELIQWIQKGFDQDSNEDYLYLNSFYLSLQNEKEYLQDEQQLEDQLEEEERLEKEKESEQNSKEQNSKSSFYSESDSNQSDDIKNVKSSVKLDPDLDWDSFTNGQERINGELLPINFEIIQSKIRQLIQFIPHTFHEIYIYLIQFRIVDHRLFSKPMLESILKQMIQAKTNPLHVMNIEPWFNIDLDQMNPSRYTTIKSNSKLKKNHQPSISMMEKTNSSGFEKVEMNRNEKDGRWDLGLNDGFLVYCGTSFDQLLNQWANPYLYPSYLDAISIKTNKLNEEKGKDEELGDEWEIMQLLALSQDQPKDEFQNESNEIGKNNDDSKPGESNDIDIKSVPRTRKQLLRYLATEWISYDDSDSKTDQDQFLENLPDSQSTILDKSQSQSIFSEPGSQPIFLPNISSVKRDTKP